jgi:hypothetical protein
VQDLTLEGDSLGVLLVETGKIISINKAFQFQTVGSCIKTLIEVRSFVFRAFQVPTNSLNSNAVTLLGGPWVKQET